MVDGIPRYLTHPIWIDELALAVCAGHDVVFLFPSLYDDFGWPPLETMASGVPAVASKAASQPEVIGDAGTMYPPDDYDGLAEARFSVLANERVRKTLVERGLARARQFTWEGTARKTSEVYERVP